MENYQNNQHNKKAASPDYSKVRYSADPQKARAVTREQYSTKFRDEKGNRS